MGTWVESGPWAVVGGPGKGTSLLLYNKVPTPVSAPGQSAVYPLQLLRVLVKLVGHSKALIAHTGKMLT